MRVCLSVRRDQRYLTVRLRHIFLECRTAESPTDWLTCAFRLWNAVYQSLFFFFTQPGDWQLEGQRKCRSEPQHLWRSTVGCARHTGWNGGEARNAFFSSDSAGGFSCFSSVSAVMCWKYFRTYPLLLSCPPVSSPFFVFHSLSFLAYQPPTRKRVDWNFLICPLRPGLGNNQ